MNRSFKVLTVLLACCQVPLNTASADLIYDSGVDTSDVATWTGSGLAQPVPADDGFTLGLASTVNEVQWTGVYQGNNTPPAADAVTIEFYAFSNFSPGTTTLFSDHVGSAVNRTDTGVNLPGPSFDLDSYRATIPDPAAARHRLTEPPSRLQVSVFTAFIDQTSMSRGRGRATSATHESSRSTICRGVQPSSRAE